MEKKGMRMHTFVGFVALVLAVAFVAASAALLAPQALEAVAAWRTPAFLFLLAGAEIVRRRMDRNAS
jgi:lipopolysaccharide export LptBFGC system permease protein LptF